MIGFKNIPMQPKLVGLFLAIGLLPLVLIGWLIGHQINKSLRERAFAQLETVREIRKIQIEDYVNERMSDLSVLSVSSEIIEG